MYIHNTYINKIRFYLMLVVIFEFTVSINVSFYYILCNCGCPQKSGMVLIIVYYGFLITFK